MKKLVFARIQFTAIGGFQEKFISELIEHNIDITDLHNSDDILFGTISAFQYINVVKIAKKYGLKIRIKNKFGLYFSLYKLRKRWGIITGTMCCSLIIIILSLFVWDIDIIGNKNITDEQVLRVLQEVGIGVGVPRLSFDSNVCEIKLKNKINNISWISIEREGSRVFVKISETDEINSPEITIDTPCNIVSDYDGILVEAIVKRGQLTVKEGDAVYKGQMLINGAIDDNGGHMLYVHSEGDFKAICDINEEFYIPFKNKINIKTNQIFNSEYLVIGGFSIPIPWRMFDSDKINNYMYSEDTFNYSFLGLEMPFKKRIGTYTLMNEIDITYTNEDVIKLLEKNKIDYEKNFLSEFTIVDCTKAFFPDENGIKMELKYKVEREIGKKQKIGIMY